ncbi:DUF2087 domain-containing protein [Curtobacterium sp. UCD-KPL2560]|uniref:DUF2087 domain-containing protein n=1 Tax=Curtobacterium sp. UCD-KPL2560 TaxID=1885315 RepID=UPI000826A598|nr:DUF2087 domain-containing protein [Curtobacterium sp. UCD-KPL2560]
MTGHTGRDWRPVFAVLADDDRRRVYAQVALGAVSSPAGDGEGGQLPARTRRALRALQRVGLVTVTDDGGYVAGPEVFAAALAAGSSARPQGVERFLEDGRIAQYPASPADRRAVLQWVVEQALTPEEVLDERAVTERLRRFHEDPVTLRRYLVDFGLVVRDADGSAYSRTRTAG